MLSGWCHEKALSGCRMVRRVGLDRSTTTVLFLSNSTGSFRIHGEELRYQNINKVPTVPSLVHLGVFQGLKSEETTPVRLTYHTKENFKKYSRALGIMDDFKSGVPRTAYRSAY